MSKPNRVSLIGSFAVLALILALLGGVGQVTAQDTAATPEGAEATATEAIPTPLPPPVRAFLEAEAAVDALPDGPATINLSTIIISPRVALRATITNGPVLILVESGTLTIDSDAALVGLPPSQGMSSLQPVATPAPAPAESIAVTDGNQILLPAETRVQLRNMTDEEVELTLISIAPEGLEGFGQPAD